MPADIVNMNKFKKAKAREKKTSARRKTAPSSGGRRKSGAKEEDEAARRNTLLDGARREGGIPSEGDGKPTAERRQERRGQTVSRPVKRSFSIKGHRTSISLEAAFWAALKEAAEEDRVPLANLIATIDQTRGGAGLSSAVRVWLLARTKARARN